MIIKKNLSNRKNLYEEPYTISDILRSLHLIEIN